MVLYLRYDKGNLYLVLMYVFYKMIFLVCIYFRKDEVYLRKFEYYWMFLIIFDNMLIEINY